MKFSDLYTQHYGLLYFWMLHLTRNPEQAEDLTGRAFEKALENRGTLRDESKFKAWLYQIACNEWKLSYRGQRLVGTLEDAQEIPEPLNFVDQLAARQMLQRTLDAIRFLKPKQRRTIQRVMAGKECQGTWGSRLHEARKNLQGVL